MRRIEYSVRLFGVRSDGAAVNRARAVTLEDVVVHDGAEELLKGAADQRIVPPDDFTLKRFETWQGDPAKLAHMHSADCRGREARNRQILNDRLESASARRAKLRGNCQLGAR